MPFTMSLDVFAADARTATHVKIQNSNTVSMTYLSENHYHLVMQ